MTAAQGRHMSVTPSPLSQSSSAVHLQAPQPEIELPRKLSKRKPPTIGSIFAPHSAEGHRKTTSAPVTPIDHITLAQPPDVTFLPKRMSVAPPPTLVPPQTSKKEKRGSMLNRLAKKFSLLRKPTDYELYSNDKQNAWQHPGGTDDPSRSQRELIPSEKSLLDPIKRVPPPAFEHSTQPTLNGHHVPERSSLASLDTPFSIGRLTVANPDLPSLETETPDFDEAPLPPEKPRDLPDRNHAKKTVEPSSLQPQTLLSRIQSRQDKPLPPPQPTTPGPSLVDFGDTRTLQANEKSLPGPSLEHALGESSRVTENAKVFPEDSKIVTSQTPSASVNTKPIVDTTPTPTERQQQPQSSQSQIMPEDTKKSDAQSQPISLSNHKQPVTDDRGPTRSASLKTEMQEENSRRPSSLRRTSPTDASAVNKSSAPEQVTPTATSRPSERPFSPPAPGASKMPSSSGLDPTRLAATVPVPFPATQPILARETRGYAAPSYEDSPLSASSVIANPPTPYNRLSISLSEVSTLPPTLPPKSIAEVKPPSHEPSPVNSSSSRQTETFKLVRSSSGNVYASGETILAAGQQWEVVESVEAKEKKGKSSKSKEQESGGRRESKVESKSKAEPRSKADVEQGDYRHSHSHRLSKVPNYSREEPSKSRTNGKTSSQRPEERPYREERVRPEEHSLPAERPHHEERSYHEQGLHREHRTRREEKPSHREERSHLEDRSRRGERSHREGRPHREERREERKGEHPQREERPHREDRRGEHPQREERPHREDRRGEHPQREDRPHREDRPQEEHPRREERPHREDRRYREDRLHREDRPRREDRPHQDRSHREEYSYREERSHREERLHNGENKGYKRDENHHEPKSKRSTEIPKTRITESQPVLMQGRHPDPPPIKLERSTSTTARPTSELPSAAEMNAMRAKESWEMERLWRARSMYGLEPNAPTTNFIPGPGSTSSRSDDAPPHPAIHGSSHTAFVVQTPFHGPSAQIYHSMPTAPPPIIYSSPASIPSIPDSLSSYDPYDPSYIYRPFPTSTPTNFKASSLSRPPLNNPLPEPPRESSYEPAPLPSTRQGNRHSSDYWTKSSGITTAH